MAPVKFGLFKSRSRDHQEQPSTENLLQQSTCSEPMSPGSPIPSTSRGTLEELSPNISTLEYDSDDDDSRYFECDDDDQDSTDDDDGYEFAAQYYAIDLEKTTPTRRISSPAMEDPLMNYQRLNNRSSLDNLQDNDDAATSCDVHSLPFDQSSIAPSEDMSITCIKKNKKHPRRDQRDIQHMRDLDMWNASDVEVMQNLLSRSGNHNEQFKWEAIATARGLCTLTDNCGCADCKHAKYLNGVSDGDGGMHAAQLISAVSVGCAVQ